MASEQDGGPAFPQSVSIDEGDEVTGMSLRDWFAGQAMAGLLASGNIQAGTEWSAVAVAAYNAADAMLALRAKRD